MKKSSIFILIQVLIVVHAIFGQDQSRKIVKIDFEGKTSEKVKELHALGIDVTSIDLQGRSINALVNESDIKNIKSLGFKSETVLPDADKFAAELRNSGYFDYFHNYEQMLQEMRDIVTHHPGIALLEDIGDSYEKTVGRDGYDIWALKISDNVQVEEAEPEVFYMANMHAREIITPEIIIYFMHYLIDNYESDAYVTHLVNNRQIWLCPTFNPDGHEYVFSGSNPNNYNDPMWWRKNKRDNNNNGFFDPDSDGVDLNRNFGFAWAYDNIGSSPSPTSNVYRGTTAFSEPESKAIKDFVEKHNFIINLSFHSHGQLWLYPWGYINVETPDHYIFQILADSCVAYNKYKPGIGFGLYPVNGDTDDWFYGEQTTKNKIFGFTPEVGNTAESVGGYTGFFPDTMFIEKQVLENQGPMLYLAYAAGEEPIIEHKPLKETESLGPYPVTAFVKPPIPLTDDPVLVDEANIKLFYNGDGAAPFDSVFMQPTGSFQEFSAEIPGIVGVDTIYYYLTASDQNGRTATLPIGAPMASFAFRIGEDTEPPSVKHVPYPVGSIYATGFPISAFATDNVEISQVELIYRINNGEIDTLSMLPTLIPDEYQAIIIPAELIIGDYYEYQILARDNSSNKNSTQIPESGYYRFYIKNSIFYDFELEPSLLTVITGDWEWGVPASGPFSTQSGSKLWATNLVGNYSDLKESILETPEISLADKDSAQLSFWHWYQNEYSDNKYWDGGNIKISIDGSQFEVIEPEDGYDGIIDAYNKFMADEACFGGPPATGNFWQQEVVNLNNYVGHNIKIRFHFASDGAVNDLGWYIDDVEIAFEQSTSIARRKLQNNIPAKFELSQNYPNPFNPVTKIRYSVPHLASVRLDIFNLMGQHIKSIVNEKQTAGKYKVFWNGKDEQDIGVTSGVYFYQLKIDGNDGIHTFTRKMVKLQ